MPYLMTSALVETYFGFIILPVRVAYYCKDRSIESLRVSINGMKSGHEGTHVHSVPQPTSLRKIYVWKIYCGDEYDIKLEMNSETPINRKKIKLVNFFVYNKHPFISPPPRTEREAGDN